MFQFGTNEVIVGRGANGQFVGLNVGETIVSGQNRWQVVGVFEADGAVSETEIWCDARALQGAYRRGNSYQSVLAKLDSPASFDTFKDWLTSNPQLNVQVRRESEFYAQQSQVMSSLIRGIGYTIAVYPLTLLNVSIQAMRAALGQLKAGQRAAAAMDFEALKSAVGFPAYYAEEAKYRS